MSTWNQRMDRVFFCLTLTPREVVEESDNTTQPHRSSTQSSSLRNNVKNKNAEIYNRNKSTKFFFKISTVARCNKCQGYDHIAVDCTSPVKITAVNEVPILAPDLKALFL